MGAEPHHSRGAETFVNHELSKDGVWKARCVPVKRKNQACFLKLWLRPRCQARFRGFASWQCYKAKCSNHLVSSPSPTEHRNTQTLKPEPNLSAAIVAHQILWRRSNFVARKSNKNMMQF